MSKRLEELINKLLKWNLSQAFLQDLTSTKKLHCKTTIFWETPPNDCFCLEIRNRKYCFCLARHILLPYFFPYTDVINISKYNISIVILWRTLLRIFRSDFWKRWKNTHSFHNIHISFLKFYFVHIVKVCFVSKNIYYAYIPPYMHKTLPTLGNEKEQQQIKF